MFMKEMTLDQTVSQVLEQYDCDDPEQVYSDCRDFFSYINNELLSKTPHILKHDIAGNSLEISVSTENEILDYATDHLIPFSCTWEIIDSCNLDCVHCYCANTGETIWTLEQSKELVDLLYEQGTMDLEITGGECLANPDFIEILNYINEKGFIVTILTNATLIDSTIAETIASIKPRNVQVSIYSLDEEVHDGITSVPGSLERSLHGIKVLTDKNVPIAIATPIMNSNINHVQSLREWASRMHYDINFSYKMSPSLSKEKSPLSQSVIPQENDATAFPDLFMYTNFNTKLNVIANSFRRTKPGSNKLCQAGFRNLSIDAYGNVSPCNSLRFSFGNLKESCFSDVWFSTAATQWRRITIEDYPTCATCDARYYCEPCPADYYASTGDLYGIDSQSCTYGKALYAMIQEVCHDK